MENSSQVAMHKPRSRKTKITVVACVAGMIIVAGIGAWLLRRDSSGFPSVPSLVLERERDSELAFVISNPNPNNVIPWNDVYIKLEATPTDPGASYTYAYWEWRPNNDLLTSQNGESVTQSINSSISTPSHMIVCNLTDVTGNGVVNDGDTFVLIPIGNEVVLAGVPCAISVIYIPMGRQMETLRFHIGENGPVNFNLILLLLSASALAVAAVALFLHFRGKTRKTT